MKTNNMADNDELYIIKTEQKIKDLVQKLGWDLEDISRKQANGDYVDCPNDKRHRVPKNSLQDHLKKCSLAAEGYGLGDLLFPESFPSQNFVVMTADLQEQIIREKLGSGGIITFGDGSSRPVPRSSNRLLMDFSREERLAIYEFAREQTVAPVAIPDVDLILPEKTETPRELSEVEKAILERDSRRRRTTYRNKVHLNNKSHTEVIREVIASQMEDMVKNEKKKPRRDYSEDSRRKTKKKKRDRSREKRHKDRKRTHHKKTKKSDHKR